MAYGSSTQAHLSSAAEIAIIAIGTCALVHPSSVEDRRFEEAISRFLGIFSTDSLGFSGNAAMAGKFIGPGPEFPFGSGRPQPQVTTSGSSPQKDILRYPEISEHSDKSGYLFRISQGYLKDISKISSKEISTDLL